MLITNKYLRKLVWGIGFALFCALLSGIYSSSAKNRRSVIVRYRGVKKELFFLPNLMMFLVMTVFAGIRLNVGSDFYNYYMRFNNIHKEMSFMDDILITFDGYKWLSYLIKQFTDYEYAIFTVIAVMLYGFLFRLIKDEVKDHAAAFTCYLFLGFFANSLNILKQCIAMMFVMCFYKMLREKKMVKCATFAVLAVLFHYSAVFALAIIGVFTVIKIKPSRKLFFIAIVSGVFMVLVLPQIISLIIKFIPSASGYAVYINWRRNGQIRLVLAVVGMSLMYAILLWVIIKNKNIIKEQNETRYLEILFLIIGLCINIASIRIWVVQRMALYFYQFIILILPTMFQGMKSDKKRRIKQVLYLVMFMYLIFSGIFLGENEYYSYNTVFSGDKPMYDADFNRLLH